MPLLKSAKHEHFAQLCAKGEKPAKAYTSAGYSEKGAHQSAAKLLKKPEISSRIAELAEAVIERTIEKAGVDRAYVVAGLKELAERCMQHVPVLDRKGKQVFVETPDGQMAAAYTFQPNAAAKAYIALGETEGIFIKRVETGAPGDFGLPAAPDQAKELLDRIRAEKGVRKTVAPKIPQKV